MDSTKRVKAAGFTFCAIAAILEIAGLVFFAIMGSDGKGMPTIVWITAICGILLAFLSLALASRTGDSQIVHLIGFAIAVLFALSFILMIQQRIAVVTLVLSNHTGTIGMPFILCAVFFGLACLVQIIDGYLPFSKFE